ncbi:MAG TPA: DUF5329 domain-containing protein [Albitalea sp.]|nr:DUF5329 domain-containing protein [Albitalea sp.]
MRCRLAAFILFLFAAAAPCSAAPLPAAARAEIEALLERLGGSACQFNRNGTWYGAAQAKDHLVSKLNYLVDREMIATAEQFIELAASRSSMSGTDYLVQCRNGPSIPSAAWLTAELHALRKQHPAKATTH